MEEQKALKVLNPRSVWLPVIIGLLVVAYLAYQDEQFTQDNFSRFNDFKFPFVLLILLIIAVKDGLNALRIRFLSHQTATYTQAIRIILIWEFAIAVTPPVLGAAAVLVFVIYKEGLPFGKALAYTLLLATLDNLFFLTASPLAIWLSDGAVFPQVNIDSDLLSRGVPQLFWVSYSSIALYTAFMLSALLFFPKTIRKILVGLMSIKFLKRWKVAVIQQSDELILASQVLKGQSVKYWLMLIFFTYAVWILKYFLVNSWIMGFVDVGLADQLLMIGRHLVMWVVMLVSPSPGNAGTAEYIYPIFYDEFAQPYTFLSSILWRFATYYPYLIIGVFLIPKWWKK